MAERVIVLLLKRWCFGCFGQQLLIETERHQIICQCPWLLAQTAAQVCSLLVLTISCPDVQGSPLMQGSPTTPLGSSPVFSMPEPDQLVPSVTPTWHGSHGRPGGYSATGLPLGSHGSSFASALQPSFMQPRNLRRDPGPLQVSGPASGSHHDSCMSAFQAPSTATARLQEMCANLASWQEMTDVLSSVDHASASAFPAFEPAWLHLNDLDAAPVDLLTLGPPWKKVMAPLANALHRILKDPVLIVHSLLSQHHSRACWQVARRLLPAVVFQGLAIFILLPAQHPCRSRVILTGPLSSIISPPGPLAFKFVVLSPLPSVLCSVQTVDLPRAITCPHSSTPYQGSRSAVINPAA